MDKDVWRWIIKGYTDKELLQKICEINDNATNTKTKKIEIRGISDFNKIKPAQLNLFRSRIESELLKTINLNKLKKILKKNNSDTLENEVMTKINELDFDMIYKESLQSKDYDIRKSIIYLVTQNETVKVEKGNQLYHFFIKDIIDDDQKEKGTEKETTLVLNGNEVEELSNTISKLKKDIEIEKNSKIELNETIKSLEKEVFQLKKENNEMSKNFKKVKTELALKKESLYNSEQCIKEKESLIERERKEQVNNKIRLQDQLIYIEQLKETLTEYEQNFKGARKIYFVGKGFPENVEMPDSIELRLIENNRIDELVINDPIYEIWFIEFRLPRVSQYKLIEKYNKKVVGFTSVTKLKEYVSLF